jgi:hypothetical protein
VRPWDRTDGESPQAHSAFVGYMHMPPAERSLARLGRSLGKSTALLEGWSARHAWVQRCAEWDRFLEDQAVDAAVDEVRQMARRHAQLGDLLVGMVHQRAASIVANGHIDAIPVEQVPRWAHVGVMIGRLARGAASEILAPEGAAAQAGGRTLGELFQAPPEGQPGLSELELARAVVERSAAGRLEPDLDQELAEILAEGEDPDDDGGDDDPAEAPVPAEVDQVAQAWKLLREHPRRPAPGDLLVAWLAARRTVGLDPDPTIGRPGPRRRRRRAG